VECSGYPPHPRVFLSKSAQSIENKGRQGRKKLQESSRVRKRLVGKKIEEIEELKERGRGVNLVWGACGRIVRRVFTSDHTKD
jgi:hypothetical protein